MEPRAAKALPLQRCLGGEGVGGEPWALGPGSGGGGGWSGFDGGETAGGVAAGCRRRRGAVAAVVLDDVPGVESRLRREGDAATAEGLAARGAGSEDLGATLLLFFCFDGDSGWGWGVEVEGV